MPNLLKKSLDTTVKGGTEELSSRLLPARSFHLTGSGKIASLLATEIFGLVLCPSPCSTEGDIYTGKSLHCPDCRPTISTFVRKWRRERLLSIRIRTTLFPRRGPHCASPSLKNPRQVLLWSWVRGHLSVTINATPKVSLLVNNYFQLKTGGDSPSRRNANQFQELPPVVGNIVCLSLSLYARETWFWSPKTQPSFPKYTSQIPQRPMKSPGEQNSWQHAPLEPELPLEQMN